MRSEEQKLIEQLIKAVEESREQNRQLIEALNKRIERTYTPVSLEQDILQTTQQSIQKAIQDTLVRYDSPLVKIVTSVINEYTSELKTIVKDSFNEVISTDEFKQAIREGFSHKIARTIISNNDGLFDKVSNELKQDAIFKSKMALAVSNVINECLENRK